MQQNRSSAGPAAQRTRGRVPLAHQDKAVSHSGISNFEAPPERGVAGEKRGVPHHVGLLPPGGGALMKSGELEGARAATAKGRKQREEKGTKQSLITKSTL